MASKCTEGNSEPVIQRETGHIPRGLRPRMDTYRAETGKRSPRQWLPGTCREASGRNPAMNDYWKSDEPILPTKSPNKVLAAAEGMEGRGLTEGSPLGQNIHRTQGRVSVENALERIRQVNLRDKRARLTSLYHHIYSVESLRAAYYGLKRDAAVGVDGEAWHEYGENLAPGSRISGPRKPPTSCWASKNTTSSTR